MIVELTNHYIEASATYEVEKIISNTYSGVEYFRFYFGNGKYSKEYKNFCIFKEKTFSFHNSSFF